MLDNDLLHYARTVNLPAFLESEYALRPTGIKGEERFYHSPFRAEKKPSLHVSRRNGIWIWFDHGSVERSGGDAIAFLRQYGYTFTEAAEKLAEFNGWHGDIKKRRKIERKFEIPDPKKAIAAFVKEMMDKITQVRKTYSGLPAPGKYVESYFTDRGLPFHPEIGARLFVDFKHSTKYIAFPLPYPSVMRGMELREAIPASRELSSAGKKRKCYGHKTMWVLRRSSERMLISESIIDALASEVLFGLGDATLVGLNGVGLASEVATLLRQTTPAPKEVYVVVDNDEPGLEAREMIRAILADRRIKGIFPDLTEKDALRELLQRRQYGVKKRHLQDKRRIVT